MGNSSLATTSGHCQSPVLKAFLYCLLAFTTVLLLPTLRAVPQDPSDLFLKAYQEVQNAELLEHKNIPDRALVQYRNAANILFQIQKDSADWQPLVVSYRLRKTQESIARLETSSPSSDQEAPARADAPSLSITPPTENSQGFPGSSPPGLPVSKQASTPTTPDEVQKLRRQLEQALQENQRLQAAVATAHAEKQSALVEVDKVKVSLAETKSQNSDVQSIVDTLRRQTERTTRLQQAYQAQASSLQKQVDALQSDQGVLSEENERLLTKLERAALYIRGSDQIRESLQKDRKSFYQATLSAKNKLQQIRDNTQQIQQLKKTNQQFQEKNLQLSQKLKNAKEEAAENLLKADTRARNSEKQAKKLVDENTLLSAQLAQTQEKLLQKESSQKEENLTAPLRSELNSVNHRLLQTQAEVAQRQIRITELEKQLDNTSKALAQLPLPSTNEDARRQRQENELLRHIILREMQAQTRHDQARQRLGDELQRLQVQSATLSEQLTVLEKPVLQLTEEEKILFGTPLVKVSSGTGLPSLSGSVSIIKKTGTPTAPSTPPSQHPQSTPDAPASGALTSEQKSLATLAETAFQQGRLVDSEALYGRLVEKNPNNASILANLGTVQSRLEKYSAAEASLRKAMALNPYDAFASTTLGILQLKRAQINNAVETLKNSVRLNPQDATTHNYLGIAYGETGDLEDAEKELKLAVQLNPNYATAHFNLAVLYSTQKIPNKELARKHYLLATHLGATPDPALERLIQ